MILSELEEDCGKEYYERLHDSLEKSRVMEGRKELIIRFKESGILDQTAFALVRSLLSQMREELEKETLPVMLRHYPQFNFRNVVSRVYEDGLSIPELIKVIDDSIDLNKQSLDQRNAFLDFISTIWNIYPHKDLDGYSPN